MDLPSGAKSLVRAILMRRPTWLLAAGLLLASGVAIAATTLSGPIQFGGGLSVTGNLVTSGVVSPTDYNALCDGRTTDADLLLWRQLAALRR